MKNFQIFTIGTEACSYLQINKPVPMQKGNPEEKKILFFRKTFKLWRIGSGQYYLQNFQSRPTNNA
jgi:hypothetical protein